MAEATTVNQRPTVLSFGPVLAAIIATAFIAMIVIAALVVPALTAPAGVQPRTDAVLDSGRAWQRQYESMSGLEARHERQAEAVLQSGRDWEAIRRQISGE